ncbi:MAG: hypothetical protein ACJ735_00515 [Actinomycetes bacterium]
MRRLMALMMVAGLAGLVGCTGHASKIDRLPRSTGQASALPSADDPFATNRATDRPQVAGDRFTQPFVLDRGALRVDPPLPQVRAVETISRVRVAMREADPAVLGGVGAAHPVVGYGVVTISSKLWPSPTYAHTPAWVVIYEDNRGSSCPAMTGRTSPPPKPSPPLPHHHYTVFVLPDAETWAVMFTERAYGACGGAVLPSKASLAKAATFARWHVVTRNGRHVTVAFTMPSCASVGGWGSEGSPQGSSLGIEVDMPFGRPPRCAGTKSQTQHFTLSTATTKLAPPAQGPWHF